MNNNTGHVMLKKSTFAVLIAISCLLVVLSSYYYYHYASGKLRESKHQELKAISQLKVEQMVQWHQERLGDAKLLSSSPLFNDGVERWMDNRDLAQLKHDIVQRLVAPVKHYNYSDIVLVSTAGELLLSTISKPHELESTLVRKIVEAARTKNITKTDLYACGAENAIHYDFVAPLVDDNDKTIALLVLRRDPNLVLFPLIQSWPTPSLTSETVIARRDGDSVIVLNELRHKANTALKVRFPLTMTELPTVKAVLGHEGIFEGKDYRGIEVLTDISRVPETPWVMIAKIDQSEVYAGLRTTAAVILGFGILTILVISVGFSLIYNSRRKDIYRALYNKEKEVWQAQEKFNITIDSLGDGVITTDVHGKIGYMNKIGEELTGWTSREASGRNLTEVYHVKNEETGLVENNIVQKVIKLGIVRDLSNSTILISKNGTEIPVTDTGAPIRDIDGTVIGLVLTFQDETEKRLQQKRIRESEAKLQEAQRLAKLGSWELDLQTMTPSWSLETYRIHEVDASAKPDLEGAINFYAPEARPIITEAINRCIQDGTPWILELPFITAKGSNLCVRAQGEAEFRDGKCVRLFGTFQDITERKQADADRLAREIAERANYAKSEFLSRMSHELRTPMNSVLGFAQLLEMDELKQDQMHNVKHILKSGRHLLDLIDEVLDIAKIESRSIKLSPETVQLDDAINSSVDLIRPLANQRGITINVKFPSLKDIFITADQQRLKQVMLNLLSNAVKYNREKGEINLEASLLTDGYLHLTVADTGEGIPPEKMNRLFTAFDRLELDSTKIQGTGLGLALSKGLIEAMGGRIGAKSDVGKGTTFWIDLQLTTQQKEEAAIAEVDDYLNVTTVSKQGLVLYVEDNLANIQLVEKIFTRLPGVKIISAMQGRMAMDLIRLHTPQLILLDVHLPDINGIEVLAQLSDNPETKNIPVVIMSADATQGQIERARAAGARTFLTKPINVKKLLTTVGNILAD